MRRFAPYAEPTSDEERVRRHAPLIARVARRIAFRAGNPALAEELWSAGAMGLLDAARRFDGRAEATFETFAEHRIRGAMLDALRESDPLPRRMRQDVSGAAACRAKLSVSLGRTATDDEVASTLGIGVDQLQALEQLAQPAAPLTPDLPLVSELPLADEAYLAAEQRVQLVAQIACLPERLQLVLSLHYVEDLTYKEIARVLQVTEARVCQLHKEATVELRQRMKRAEEPKKRTG